MIADPPVSVGAVHERLTLPVVYGDGAAAGVLVTPVGAAGTVVGVLAEALTAADVSLVLVAATEKV